MLNNGPEIFTTSVADFLDHDPGRRGDREARIYIAVKVERLEVVVYAMVDTGAPYSIMNPEIAENAGLDLQQGEKTKIETRFGKIPGWIVRGTILVPAKEGRSVEVDASIFVPESEWPGPNFLGYHGFLEGIRFAVSPTEYEFHFGRPEGPLNLRLPL